MKNNAEKSTKAEKKESMIMAVLAMLGFVAWGLWVNWEYGWGSRLQVAATQGVVSLVSTWLSAEVIRWMVKRQSGSTLRRVLRGGGMSYAAIYFLVLLAHWSAGTPELLATMAPGMITGVFFCFGYAWRVTKA